MSLTRPYELPAPEPLPLIPELRAKQGAAGVPLAIDGQEWLLAWGTIASSLDSLRDTIYESWNLRQAAPAGAVFQCAWVLLTANYELADDEVMALLNRADGPALTDATLDALFGFAKPAAGYSDWVRLALYCGGLDPSRIPPELIPLIANEMVRQGRAPAVADLVPAVRTAMENAKVAAFVRSAPARPAPEPAPAPEPTPETDPSPASEA